MSSTKNSEFASIAVVNDDLTQLSVLAGLLKKKGYRVQKYENPVPALDEMKPDAVPDLIVTDLYMPEVDGWRFCRLLRSPEFKHLNKVPIIVNSATFSGEEAQRIAADLGAEAFLPSPIDGKQFLDTVDAVLQNVKSPFLPRVLVLEDSQSLAALLQSTLTDYGYQADIALTIRQARELIKDHPYEIAILDYHLPDGTGDCLLDSFRNTNLDTACIMMTADPSPKLALTWMRAGAVAYLHKPFDPEYMIELCGRTRREHALLRVEKLLEKRTMALAESEERLRQIIDLVPHFIFVKDINGRYTLANKAVADAYGTTVDELVGKKDADFIRAEDGVSNFQNNDQIAIDSNEPLIIPDEQFIDAQRNIRRLSTVKIPFTNSSGNSFGLLGVSVDITELKYAEEQVKTSLKEKETLLHEIHHRVKNNMQVISSLLKLQSDNINNNQVKEILKESQNRVYALSAVHEALHGSENLSNIDMKTYLFKITTTVFQAYSVSADNVKLVSNMLEIPISTDQASSLGLIINELISNSLKYAFPDEMNGEITVSTKELNNQIELLVGDNGVGMPDKFDWKNTSSLGLKLVRTLVENQLDGSIDMKRKNGTKFTIRFNIET